MSMNRAARRKMQKKTGITDKQLEQLQNEANMQYIELEVQKRMKYNEKLLSEAMGFAFSNNNIPSAKVSAILDDISLYMRRKVKESKNNGRA